MPRKSRIADDDRIRRKHEAEKNQKAPMAIILDVSDESNEGDNVYQTLRDIFGRILIFSYSLPLNGKAYEFEKMSKEADYFLVISNGIKKIIPPEINQKMDNIVKANYAMKIIVQENLEIPAFIKRKITIFESTKKLKNILS